MTIEEMVADWSIDDIKNLNFLLDGSGADVEINAKSLQEKIWALYNNDARNYSSAILQNAVEIFTSVVGRNEINLVDTRSTWALPSYEDLLSEVCNEFDVSEPDASTGDLEAFLTQKLLIDCLAKLRPRERMRVLETKIDMEVVAKEANISSPSLVGEASLFGAMALASSSGFGVYLAATTILGALTSVIGVTLPFAIYMGLTSTMAVLLGPVGWAALVGSIVYKVYKLTGPKWGQITPALIYIIAVKNRPNMAVSTGAAPQ